MDHQLTREEVRHIVEHFAEYNDAYRTYLNLTRNTLTILWTSFLLLPAVMGLVFPALDLFILGLFIVSGLVLLQVMNKLNKFLVNIYLRKINRPLGELVDKYLKYNRIIHASIREVLKEGTNDYQTALLTKVQSKL